VVLGSWVLLCHTGIIVHPARPCQGKKSFFLCVAPCRRLQTMTGMKSGPAASDVGEVPQSLGGEEVG